MISPTASTQLLLRDEDAQSAVAQRHPGRVVAAVEPFLSAIPVHHLRLELTRNLLTEQTWNLLWCTVALPRRVAVVPSGHHRLVDLRSLDLNLAHNRVAGHTLVAPFVAPGWTSVCLHTLRIDLSNNRGRDEGYAACLGALGALGDRFPNLRVLELAMHSRGPDHRDHGWHPHPAPVARPCTTSTSACPRPRYPSSISP